MILNIFIYLFIEFGGIEFTELQIFQTEFMKQSEEPIGRGQFGRVFKVQDKNNNNLYAIKQIKIKGNFINIFLKNN